MILRSVVLIIIATDDIHIFVARIVVLVLAVGCPYPDEVVHTLSLECVEHKLPEFLILCCTVVAPPEPSCSAVILITVAGSFMQRSPQYRDTFCLKVEQIVGHYVEVLQGECVLPSSATHCILA